MVHFSRQLIRKDQFNAIEINPFSILLFSQVG
jgi:hypothetical protein